MMYWKDPFQEEEEEELKEKRVQRLTGIYRDFSVNGHDVDVQVCGFRCTIRNCERDLSE